MTKIKIGESYSFVYRRHRDPQDRHVFIIEERTITVTRISDDGEFVFDDNSDYPWIAVADLIL